MRERVRQVTVESTTVPQSREEIVEVKKLQLFERVHQRTAEVPMPLIAEETVEMMRFCPA